MATGLGEAAASGSADNNGRAWEAARDNGDRPLLFFFCLYLIHSTKKISYLISACYILR